MERSERVAAALERVEDLFGEEGSAVFAELADAFGDGGPSDAAPGSQPQQQAQQSSQPPRGIVGGQPGAAEPSAHDLADDQVLAAIMRGDRAEAERIRTDNRHGDSNIPGFVGGMGGGQ